MKSLTKQILTVSLASSAVLSPLVFSLAEEEKVDAAAPIKGLELFAKPEIILEPPVPVVPKDTKMTEELNATIALINAELIDPMRTYSNSRVLMSRIKIRMETEFHFAITDTSDSLFPFDVYTRHQNGAWEKIASGVCHPGMESLKVAMPKTGVMVDPIKHPLFAAALTEHKLAKEKRAG